MMVDGIDRENLQKLATFLMYDKTVEDVDFDMRRFCDRENLGVGAVDCGTTGCAVGFAPFAGIAKNNRETFIEYCDRTLIDSELLPWAWSWCFSSGWAGIDGTRKGAAKRIQYLLDGLPYFDLLMDTMRAEEDGDFTEIEDYEDPVAMLLDRARIFVNNYKNIEVKR